MTRAHPGRWPRAVALAAIVALALAIVAPPREASAHAVLVRSSPSSQAELLLAPAAIDLWFSEPLEAEFSSFELFAGDGSSLPLDGMRLDPADDHHLSALTRGLDPGYYTVVYRTLSTRDGHEWNGSYTFTILEADGSLPSGATFRPDLGGGDSPPLILGRWFSFVGFSVVLGGGLVALFATLAADRDPREPLPRAASRSARRLALAALPLILAGAYLQLESQRESLGGSLLDLLGDTRLGTMLIWRGLIALALAATLSLAFLAVRRRRDRIEAALTLAVPLFGAAGMLTIALLSHAAAAPGSFWAVSFDLVHLVLAGLWVGGLIALAALFVRTRREGLDADFDLVETVARFSVFAALAIYVLATTGVLRSVGEIPNAAALFESGYGRWLLVKLALLTPVLGVALANRSLLARWTREQVADSEASARLRRTLAVEAGLAVVVLASVAVLGQVPTPRGSEAPPATSIAAAYNRIEVVDDLNLHLQVTPAEAGPNELRVHVYRPDSTDPGAIQLVQLSLAAPGVGGGDTLTGEHEGDGIFTATAILSSAAPTWNIAVDVRREGFDDARAAFEVPIAAPAGTGGDGAFGSFAPQLSINVVWAMLLFAPALAVFVSQRNTPKLRGTVLRAGSVGAIFLATVLVVSADRHGEGTPALVNPSPGDPQSIERGQVLYATNCATCHGVGGRGDGPAAPGLNPPPADLALHVPLHPEADTYAFIEGGFPGTAMPAWGDQLNDQQIWDLVNFLRSSFGDGTESAAATQ